MEFLRTPLERFEAIKDYPFGENYMEVGDGMRMHYVDEGAKEGEVVVMLHGEPSWSYLYRKMIPIFVENGFRAIAPDLIGFGKSDKPTKQEDYTYQAHLDWLEPIFANLGLQKITLFLQDWGGLLGLRLLEKYDHIIDRLVVANTFLPAGYRKSNEAFTQWQQFSQMVPEFPVGKVINMGTISKLSQEVTAAYDAPFPDETYKAGARVFPSLVPFGEDNPECLKNRKVWAFLNKYEKPTLTLFSDSDPIMKGIEKFFMRQIPGTRNMPHQIIANTGHFVQEEKGELLAKQVVAFIQNH